MNNQIKQNITECQNIIEHIRNSINDGKCNFCPKWLKEVNKHCIMHLINYQ